MPSTNKIKFIGYIDDQQIDRTMEFATLDKDAVLQSLRKQAGSSVYFSDIDGNFLFINFARASVVSIRVIELVS